MIWMVTFSCAVSFHTVDIRMTEYLDYFTAMLATLFGVWGIIVRVFEVTRPSTMWMIASPLMGFYGFHLMRMAFVHFSYGYNMRVTISLAVVNSCISAVWCFSQYRSSSHVKWMLMGHSALLFFVSLEVIDRPPFLGMFDTHAIWHLTINVIFFFYNRFYIYDTLHYPGGLSAKSE